MSLRQPDDNLEIDSLCCHVGNAQRVKSFKPGVDLVKVFDISPFGLLLSTTGGIKSISPYKVAKKHEVSKCYVRLPREGDAILLPTKPNCYQNRKSPLKERCVPGYFLKTCGAPPPLWREIELSPRQH